MAAGFAAIPRHWFDQFLDDGRFGAAEPGATRLSWIDCTGGMPACGARTPRSRLAQPVRFQSGAVLRVYPGTGESSSQLNLRFGGVFKWMGFSFKAADQNGYRVFFWGIVIIPFIYLLVVLIERIGGRSRLSTQREVK